MSQGRAMQNLTGYTAFVNRTGDGLGTNVNLKEMHYDNKNTCQADSCTREPNEEECPSSCCQFLWG
jgi:hypothetical protein